MSGKGALIAEVASKDASADYYNKNTKLFDTCASVVSALHMQDSPQYGIYISAYRLWQAERTLRDKEQESTYLEEE